MSTETQNSQKSGDSRRRRSRGGQNRRNNNNNSENHSSEGRQSEGRQSEGRQPNGRQSGGGKREGGRTGQTGQASQPGRQDNGKPQRRPMPAPAKLTWWEKVKKMLGLYKEPVRPPRPERRPDVIEPKPTREPRQQKTREPRTESREPRSDNRDNRESRESRNERSDSREEDDSQRRGKRKERSSGGHRGGDPSTVENRRVYVGNLSYDTTESDIEELFKGVGAVRRVEIVYNRTTHRSKGYGFVEMIDIDEAKRTVEVLHDQFFMGRKLTVSGAKSQDHQDAETEEGGNERASNVMPPLAPITPVKEEVLDLIGGTVAEAPAAAVIEEEPHAEIPTEEFHPEEETPEETKEQPNA